MTRILITGGAGFVGTQLVQLLKETHDITVLDNFMSGTNPNPDIPFIDEDIRNKYTLKKIIPAFDTIIHLAAVVGVPGCSINEQFSFDINVLGTQNIVRYMRPDARIIFTSSTSSYGNKTNEMVTEKTSLTPLTNYGLHKLYNETEIQRHTNNFIIMRPATAFGISQRTRVDVLPNTLIYTALTEPILRIYEPQVIRPFIHVIDFARALAYAVDNNMPWCEVYNIGDPKLIMQKGELAKKIAGLANTEIEIVTGKDPDQRNYDISFGKLLATGFKFSAEMLAVGFDQIKNCVMDIQNNYSAYNVSFHVKEFIKEYGTYSY